VNIQEDDNIWEEDEELEEFDEPVRLQDHLTHCPNCKKPITPEMDSCPYCGDILFRYLKDGVFIPRKGPLSKIVAILIIIVIILGTLAFLLTVLQII